MTRALLQRPSTPCYTRALFLAMPLGIAAIACSTSKQNIAVAVEPAAPPARVAFRLGLGGGFFYGLTVKTCAGDSIVWVVGTGGTDAGRPARIVYGEAPTGFATRVGPVPLTPGCYKATAGAGYTRFVVRPDGSVATDPAR